MTNIDKMYKNEKLLDAERLGAYSNAALMDQVTSYGDQLNSKYEIPKFARDLIDKIVLAINKDTPKCSIKIANSLLDEIFRFINLERSQGPLWTWRAWKTGYNSSLLPYLDLSEYDFKGKQIEHANLSGHSEIVTHAVARKKGLDKILFKSDLYYGVNLNGVDLSESTGSFQSCDLRNTGIGRNLGDEKGIINFDNGLDFCNLEGEDLSDKYYLQRNRGVNFKNTGLTVDLKGHKNHLIRFQYDRLSNIVEDCNFEGCKIAELEKYDIDGLYRDMKYGFPGTSIEYNGRVYYGTEQIVALFENVIQDYTLGSVNKQTHQKKLVK